MVKFRLVEENENYIIYWYYPEGKFDRDYGIIVLDIKNNSIEIQKLAADDFSHIVTVESQNVLRESANDMRISEGKPLLTEEEWSSATSEFTHTIYADHAIDKIIDNYDSGVILQEGASIWC